MGKGATAFCRRLVFHDGKMPSLLAAACPSRFVVQALACSVEGGQTGRSNAHVQWQVGDVSQSLAIHQHTQRVIGVRVGAWRDNLQQLGQSKMIDAVEVACAQRQGSNSTSQKFAGNRALSLPLTNQTIILIQVVPDLPGLCALSQSSGIRDKGFRHLAGLHL